jgi:hypothetical protein
MISLSAEQKQAYDRYIRARDRVRIGSYGKKQKGKPADQRIRSNVQS